MKNQDMVGATKAIKKELSETLTIKLPRRFGFRNHDILDFNSVLDIFDWDVRDSIVEIDFRECTSADYQAVSLLVTYTWHLKSNGCRVKHLINHDTHRNASAMWKKLGALGTFNVLSQPNQQFRHNKFKPLFALRKDNNSRDFKTVIENIEEYTSVFDVSYISTLRYILSELMYNTLEHGSIYSDSLNKYIPSLVQMSWYQQKEIMNFIIVDLGVGIKDHLNQAYPGIESDEEAIRLALQPEKSGTFNQSNMYASKNNAGMGLFLSSNIIRRLKGELYIISGNGHVHISPRDITSKTLDNEWKGTIAFLSIKIGKNTTADLQSMLQELRGQAEDERNVRKHQSDEEKYTLFMYNYFGDYAEIKEDAIKIRDKYLIPKVNEGKKIILDCSNIRSAPHSFLNALLATPIKLLGINAYRKIKVINAESNIRETIDFIFEDNT